MTTAPTDSLLVADIGSVTTRAALLDIVNGQFRFVALGEAPSSVAPPFGDMSEGVRHALDHLGQITGRAFLDEDERLILPARADGSGVDAFTATVSAGEPLRAVLVGLMPNISLASAQRLATTSYVRVVELFGLGDRRREDQQLDALLHAKPEVVIISGGTENGSQAAVLRLAETVALAAQLMPETARPEILFAGNSAAREKIKTLFANLCHVEVANNLRPELDDEDVASAGRGLAKMYEHLRLKRMAGYNEMSQWRGGGSITPAANAFGNVVRFLGKTADGKNRALGVDLGASSTAVAASFADNLWLTVRADVGVGHSASNLLHHVPLENVTRWLPEGLSADDAHDYIFNKSIHPATLPHEARELYLEHALACECLLLAVSAAQTGWPASASGLLPQFDRIIGTGAALARAPKAGQAALMMLNGLQPTGITQLILDWHVIAPALGAAAALNPVAAVQILETDSFQTLGTAVSLVGRGRIGQTAARIKISGGDEAVDAKVPFGSIKIFRLPPDREVKVALHPAAGFNAGFGVGAAKTLTVRGGAVGLIVDARGRPVAFPSNPAKRMAAVNQWYRELGEYGEP